MAQQEGPFSEYLQQLKITPQVQAPQPTGLEGTGSAIGNIAMNFISGLRQGRQQKYMQQQMEEQRKFDAYQQAMQRVASSGLPDAEKRSLYAELETPLIRRIAGDPEATSKKTGNPLTDVIKNIASSVAGPVPKKGMELTMDPVLKALQAVSDPERQVPYLASQLDRQAEMVIRQGINAATKSGKPVTYETLFSGDAGRMLAGLENEARRLGVTLPSIARATSEYRPMSGADFERQRKLQKEEVNRQAIEAGVPLSKPPAAPSTPPAQQLSAAPVPPGSGATPAARPTQVAGVPSAPTVPIPAGAPFVEVDPSGFFRTVDAMAQETGRSPISQAKEYIVDGKRIVGQFVSGIPLADGNRASGIYSGGKIYTGGFREPNQFDVRPPQEQLDEALNSSLEAMKGSVKPEVFDSYRGILQSAYNRGSLEGMERALQNAVRTNDTKTRQQQARSDAASRLEASGDARKAVLINGIDRKINANPKVKDYNTVFNYSAEALDAYKQATNTGKNYSLADRELVRALAKLTDLTTGVRESEYLIFSQAVGRVASLGISVNNLLKGESEILDQKTRDEIVRQINSKRKLAAGQYNVAIKAYRNQANAVGISDSEYNAMFPTESDFVPLSERKL